MTRKWLTTGIALALITAACGGSSDDTAGSTDDESVATPVSTDPSEPTATSAAGAPLDDTAPPDTPDNDGNDSDDGDDGDTSATPETDNTGSGAWQSWQLAVPQLGEAPAELEAKLTWMYGALIDLWVADDRLATAGLYDTISRTSDRRAAADTMTDMLATLTTISADSFAIIGEAATSAAGTDPISEAYFAPRAELAATYVPSASYVHSQLVTLDGAAKNDHFCFHEAMDGDECTDGAGGAAAEAVIQQLEADDDAYRDIDIEEAEDIFGADVCVAWDQAVTEAGLTDDQQLRIWVAIDGSLFDTKIVGMSECMWNQIKEDDPVVDDAVHDAALMPYLTALADAAAAGGYTEEVYDLGGGSDEEVDEFYAISDTAAELIMTAAIETASDTWSEVYDNELASRLYLVAGMHDALDGYVSENLDRYELDWDGVEDMFCRAWESTVANYDGEAYEAIVFSFSNLRFGDVVMPGACT